ncbi:hypothetical protein CEXT_755271 [Caerostris extrusa]|uniref:Uncharacterized protein n=1 Tax=Caerostris extrusa TaxID=172846 RepID=A0AAV4P3C3_CAEEX|nr:hypothetical protein CEXT_755271 [Caerostris extrusa]
MEQPTKVPQSFYFTVVKPMVKRLLLPLMRGGGRIVSPYPLVSKEPRRVEPPQLKLDATPKQNSNTQKSAVPTAAAYEKCSSYFLFNSVCNDMALNIISILLKGNDDVVQWQCKQNGADIVNPQSSGRTRRHSMSLLLKSGKRKVTALISTSKPFPLASDPKGLTAFAYAYYSSVPTTPDKRIDTKHGVYVHRAVKIARACQAAVQVAGPYLVPAILSALWVFCGKSQPGGKIDKPTTTTTPNSGPAAELKFWQKRGSYIFCSGKYDH